MAPPAALVGCDNFVRSNPMTDRFSVEDFHHVEFFCGDAATTAARFSLALGMQLTAKSDMMTGNHVYASRVLRSGDVFFVFSSPYADLPVEKPTGTQWDPMANPNPSYSAASMHEFQRLHGMSAFAVSVRVADAAEAFSQAVAGGAEPVSSPVFASGVAMSEVRLYPNSDSVLRFVSGDGLQEGTLPFLPGYAAVEGAEATPTFGINRVDHVVGNVPDLLDTVAYLAKATGFHEFAEFTAADVGTIDSGLNSMVLASNNERVLLPVNEPTTGSRRKSQIQTYLDQHCGPGVQHIALKTSNIGETIRRMRAVGPFGGFDLMERPRAEYYANLKDRLGPDALSEAQLRMCEELGVLADRDDQGVLLQIFTKPLGDRATLFLEIIQRIGCTQDEVTLQEIEQKPGCGGFGKGNFHELFRAIEEYETRAGINEIK